MSPGLCHRLNGMRIVISEFISLDGVVQAPGGPDEDTDGGFRHGGWSMRFFDPEVMGAAIGELSEATDALLYGRRTWQGMAAAWPDRAVDPARRRRLRLAQRLGYMLFLSVSGAVLAGLLVSSTAPLYPAYAGDGPRLFGISALRDQPGGCLNVWGSPTLVRALLAADLVDELLLMIEPIVLGGGKTIFPEDGEARAFELTSATTAGTGVQVCRYRADSR